MPTGSIDKDKTEENELYAKYAVIDFEVEKDKCIYGQADVAGISWNGIFIRTELKIEQGSILRLEVNCEDRLSQRIILFCVVERVKQKDRTFEAVLSYIALKQKDMQNLAGIIVVDNDMK